MHLLCTLGRSANEMADKVAKEGVTCQSLFITYKLWISVILHFVFFLFTCQVSLGVCLVSLPLLYCLCLSNKIFTHSENDWFRGFYVYEKKNIFGNDIRNLERTMRFYNLAVRLWPIMLFFHQ